MKFFRFLCTAAALYSTSLFASANGGVLIGVSPASQAMGGTGVANFTNGTDAMYKNPALLSELPVENRQATGELYSVYFNQSGSVNYDQDGTGNMKSVSSAASGRVAPSLAVTYKSDEHWAVGLGLISFGGSIADYSAVHTIDGGVGNTDFLHSANGLKTQMDLVRIPLAIAWKINDTFSVGATPFMTYGQFAVNDDVDNPLTPGVESGRNMHSKIGFGGQFGATAKFSDFLVGASFTTNSNMSYPDIVNLNHFGPGAVTPAAAGINPLEVDQPMEFAVGASYGVSPDFKVTVDGRYIGWSHAAGYSDLGWKDQWVAAIGGSYKLDNLVLRLGYNYAASPVSNISGETGATTIQGAQVYNASVTKMNQFIFPGYTEHHIGFGAGYEVTKAINVDGAFVFSPAKTVTRGGSLIGLSGPNGASYEFDSTVSQWSVALGLSCKF